MICSILKFKDLIHKIKDHMDPCWIRSVYTV